MNFCARCHRPLRRDPIVIDGRGYGPVCAANVGDLFAPVRSSPIYTRAPRRRADPRQSSLFEART